MSDPWFKFYPSDWLGGTRTLTAAETGVYITLICMMHERGHPIDMDDTRLARLCGLPARNFRRALEALIEEGKVVETDDGLWASVIDAWIERDRRGAPRPSIPTAVQADVLAEGQCAYCGSDNGPFEIDHIVPWSRGGTHDRSNLTLACQWCNRSKGDKMISEWKGALQ